MNCKLLCPRSRYIGAIRINLSSEGCSVLLIIVCVLCPFSAEAQTEQQVRERFLGSYNSYLTIDDPSSLQYSYSGQSDCFWSEQEALNSIEGIMRENGVTPVNKRDLMSNRYDDDLYLQVRVMCLIQVDSYGVESGAVVYVAIHFGKWPLLFNRPYGGILSASSEDTGHFLSDLGNSISRAVADFVAAN